MKRYLGVIFCLLVLCTVKAQEINLTLEKAIEQANDSSLEAYRSYNMYLSGYWEYRTYKANRLPSLTLKMTPAQYYRDITKRYDSEQNIDIYRNQQSFSAYGNLAVTQNFDLTGGTFYLDTELGYMRNFGENTYSQFNTVPVRIGYSQSLVGYNPFKWERRIEPLKYEKQKKDLIYNMEQVSENVVSYFFELAMAQAEYKLAQNNLVSSDILYRIGMQRYGIASISQADLLTLKLDAVNARNTLRNNEVALRRAMFSLASYLNFDTSVPIHLTLPEKPLDRTISVEDALEIAKMNNPRLLEQKQNILEAERNVDKTRKESRFNISLNASIGFNQVADNIGDVYHKPQQQDLVSLSISVPIVDWGVRKGKYNMAKNNLNVVKVSARQQEISVEEEIIMTVNEFNNQLSLIGSAEEALKLSAMAYDETVKRFMIGKSDINSLTLSLNRQQTAQRNYISSLNDYWQKYYKIRRLTLYDFVSGLSLVNRFDFDYK